MIYIYRTQLHTCVEIAILVYLLLVLSPHEGRSQHVEGLSQSLTFFSSFDNGLNADYSAGDPKLYVSSDWAGRISSAEPATESARLEIRAGEGIFGDAIYISNRDRPVYFYKGEQNTGYSFENWEGTVSFWLRLSPDEDLSEGYSDPIQLTDSAWNDGALYVDFTYDVPRSFRFAFFAERNIWDPDLREWGEVPVDERPMIEIEDHPFSRDRWVHVAFTFQNFNTGAENGLAIGYLNGEYAGELGGREQTIRWNPELSAIWLGYNYSGFMDEIAIFGRALSAEEIRTLYKLENGIAELLSN